MSTIRELLFMHKKTGEICLGFSVHFEVFEYGDDFVGPIKLFISNGYDVIPLTFKELEKEWEFIGYI